MSAKENKEYVKTTCIAQIQWGLLAAVVGTVTKLVKRVVETLMNVPLKEFALRTLHAGTSLEVIRVSVFLVLMVISAQILTNVPKTKVATKMPSASTMTETTLVPVRSDTLVMAKLVRKVSVMTNLVRSTLNARRPQNMIVNVDLVSVSTKIHEFVKTLTNA